MKKISYKNILAAIMGVFLIGMGVAFNNSAGIGNDPIGLLYDGIRSIAGLDAKELGMVSNIFNICLIILLLFLARRYINIGTIIYVLPYGTFVSIGTFLYRYIFSLDILEVRIIASVVGCLFIYLGVAICITIDIGVDPLTGIVLFFKDLTGKEYRIVKIMFDLTMILLGSILGGKFGVVTLVTAFTAGPLIQFFSKQLKKLDFFITGGEVGE